MLNTVDLPQPDGPMIDTNSPGATENDMPSTAITGPSRVAKRLERPSTRNSGSSAARGSVAVRAIFPLRSSMLSPDASVWLAELTAAGSGSVSSSCSGVNGVAVNLRSTASLTIVVEPDDPVRIDRRTCGKNWSRVALGHRDRDADELGVGLERFRVVRVHPVDRLAVGLHVAVDHRPCASSASAGWR